MSLFSHHKKHHNHQTAEQRQAVPYTPFSTMENTILAPLAGQIKPMEECSDPTFASGQVGEGVVIIPDTRLLKAPVTGTVLMIFPTLSSISVEDEQGREILMHIGINTSNMEGKPFYCYVKQGDHVEAGEPLIAIDWKAIEEKGGSREVPIVLPRKTHLPNQAITITPATKILEGQPLFKVE